MAQSSVHRVAAWWWYAYGPCYNYMQACVCNSGLEKVQLTLILRAYTYDAWWDRALPPKLTQELSATHCVGGSIMHCF